MVQYWKCFLKAFVVQNYATNAAVSFCVTRLAYQLMLA